MGNQPPFKTKTSYSLKPLKPTVHYVGFPPCLVMSMLRYQKSFGNSGHVYGQLCVITYFVSGYFGICPYLEDIKFHDFGCKLSIWGQKISSCCCGHWWHEDSLILYTIRHQKQQEKHMEGQKELKREKYRVDV